ncbi:MAG: serine/threonine protein phosphatase [Magnetococcales bacterium]|nr:serine/threonine protein phosphatase [Magnetococcales bacterium]
MSRLVTEHYPETHLIKGIAFPTSVSFRELAVTGPPGSGKSRVIRQLGGWSEEGYIDLTAPWWRNEALAFRPREVHLGLPFTGFEHAMTVFAPEVKAMDTKPDLDPARILFPPKKRFFLSVDWRAKLVFEFLLPSPDRLLRFRLERAERHTHPVDEKLTKELVAYQLDIHEQVALLFNKNGLRVHIRRTMDAPPLRIIDTSPSSDGSES